MSEQTDHPGTASELDAATDAAAATGTPEAVGTTSLSVLLGGSLEGGAACAADGTCD